jgi:hypothetical protein
MAKHHMATYVTVPEAEGENALRQLVTERLGGGDGITVISLDLVNGQLCGTFTRDWETPDPKPPKAPVVKK